MLCGIPMLDQRHCRVDVSTTLGEPVCWTVHFDQDVSGWTFDAGLLTQGGLPAEVEGGGSPLTIDVSDAANGNVELCVTGLATTEPPLGLGTWTWWLSAIVPPETEPSYILGGALGIYPVWSYNPSCPPNTGPIMVESMTVQIDTSIACSCSGDGQATIVPVGTLTGEWQWNTNPAAVPGGAQVTSDTGDVMSASWLRFADFDKTNLDLSGVIAGLSPGDLLLAQQTADAANRAVMQVLGAPVAGSGYVQVPVGYVTGAGTGGAAWQEVTVSFPLHLAP